MRAALVFLLSAFCVLAVQAADPLWLAVTTSGKIWRSSDAQAWTATSVELPAASLTYGQGRFLLVTPQGSALSTEAGLTWQNLPPHAAQRIIFGNHRFVTVSGQTLATSTDGTTFTQSPATESGPTAHCRALACGDTEAGFRYVAIGETNSTPWRAVTSDGQRWDQWQPDAPEATALTYGAGHFVIVGPRGLIERSHDGETWVRHPLPEPDDLRGLQWDGAQFVAWGAHTWTSPDGETWTPRPDPIASPGERAWCLPAHGWLRSDPSGRLWSSPDGLRWEQRATLGEPISALAFRSAE